MLYHGFYVKITPLKNIQRERKDGSISDCNGFQIEIFSNQSEEVTVDVFTAAVGFEILKNSVCDAEQFAMEDRKSTRLNSSHTQKSRMPSSA